MYVETGTELKRCVLDRVGPPNRRARPLAPRAALLAFLESLQPAQTMLRRQARSSAAAPTFDRGQHISERNIGRQYDGALQRHGYVESNHETGQVPAQTGEELAIRGQVARLVPGEPAAGRYRGYRPGRREGCVDGPGAPVRVTGLTL